MTKKDKELMELKTTAGQQIADAAERASRVLLSVVVFQLCVVSVWSVCLSVCLPACLPACLSVCLS